ncbi:MAG: sigma-70 family RNA polymerase sigma factor [Ignavibacteriales bacterium]|nr:sigma-70 family RNA polymerase sigma factor [Ignavibacteriales bacterium]
MDPSTRNKNLFLELSEATGQRITQLKVELYKNNLGLVKSILNNYCDRSDMYYEDYLSDGNTALWNAIDKFDYKRGYLFSTFAAYKIEGAIFDSIKVYSNTIKIPNEKLRLTLLIKKVLEKLKSENEGRSTNDDVWELLKEDILRKDFDQAVKNEELLNQNELEENKESKKSLEGKNHDDEGLNKHVENESELNEVIQILNEREKLIFCMCHGVLGFVKHRNVEVAKQLHISTSSVSRILKFSELKIKKQRNKK